MNAYAGSDSGELRRRAALAGHRGDAAAARTFLQSPHAAVRATALRALARADGLTAGDLRAALGDGAADVRRAAATLAAAFPEVDVVALLNDPDHLVAETAAWALGEQPDERPATVDALAATARAHPDPLCREAAVAALGALGQPGGLPAILAALGDRPAIRRRAVLALAPFEGQDVDAALARALTDRDRQVRQAAEDLSA